MPDYSRNPSDYRPEPSGHFRRRLRERKIPGAAIQKAIESGDADEQEDGRIRFTTQYLGYEFVVVVNPEKMYVITVYSTDGWHSKGEQQEPICLTS